MADVNLETATEREAVAFSAGQTYTESVQDIITAVSDNPTFADTSKAGVQLTEADATLGVNKGGANKTSNANKQAAEEVKQKGNS